MVADGATLPVVDSALLKTAIVLVFWLETYRRVVGAAGVGVGVADGVGVAKLLALALVLRCRQEFAAAKLRNPSS